MLVELFILNCKNGTVICNNIVKGLLRSNLTVSVFRPSVNLNTGQHIEMLFFTEYHCQICLVQLFIEKISRFQGENCFRIKFAVNADCECD